MNTAPHSTWSLRALLLALGAVLLAALPFPARAPDAPAPVQRVALARNVFLEVEGKKRRVIVQAVICLRQGQLEGLLCRRGTKEHEYILAADADARHVHAALVAARAKPGSPVQFEPKFAPAHGSTIKVTLRYKKDDKLVTVPAQEWILDSASKKPLKENCPDLNALRRRRPSPCASTSRRWRQGRGPRRSPQRRR